MTLTLTPDTAILLRTAAEERGLDPADLHESLLKQALAESEWLADLTTQAALSGPIFDLWNSPEEDAAWAHLAAPESPAHE